MTGDTTADMAKRGCTVNHDVVDCIDRSQTPSLGPIMTTSADHRALEEGTTFAPTFDAHGLIPAVTTDATTGEVLMVAWMNREALSETLRTGTVHYWSRSRQVLWRKGDTSGQTQALVEMRVDCDQDTLLLRVVVGGDGGCCHTGRRACFYRRVSREGTLSFIPH